MSDDLSRSIRHLIEGAAQPVTAGEAMARPTAAATGAPPRSDGADGEGLWLEDDQPTVGRRLRSRRLVGVAAVTAACLAAIVVPVVALSTASPPNGVVPHEAKGTAAQRNVLAALGATTDSGSFDFTYDLHSTPPTSTPDTTTTTVCHVETVVSGADGGPYTLVPSMPSAGGSTDTTAPTPNQHQETVCNAPATSQETRVYGSGVINTNPMAMVASAAVGGPNGLQVVVRIDAQSVYEDSGSGTSSGLAPAPSQSAESGEDLSSFAGLVESTLGTRNGAVAMLGMASPTGYLDLYQQDISGATQIGTATVDGDAVTEYQVTQNLDSLSSVAGTSPEEAKTITAAVAVLEHQGYSSNTVDVSIDGAGYIRQVKSVVTFEDGATSYLEATFSNFGCAGTVLMPGQQGSSTPPTGCTSPDAGAQASAQGVTQEPTTANTAPTVPVTTETTAPGTGSSIPPAVTIPPTTVTPPPTTTPTTASSSSIASTTTTTTTTATSGT